MFTTFIVFMLMSFAKSNRQKRDERMKATGKCYPDVFLAIKRKNLKRDDVLAKCMEYSNKYNIRIDSEAKKTVQMCAVWICENANELSDAFRQDFGVQLKTSQSGSSQESPADYFSDDVYFDDFYEFQNFEAEYV